MFTPIMPSAHSFLMTSLPFTPIFCARSDTAMFSPMRITRLCSAGVVIWVCLVFLPAAATRLRGGPPGRWPGAPGWRQSRPPGPREINPLRPSLRNSSSRSLISILGTEPSRPGMPGSWMNWPVAAEPVTTGWGILVTCACGAAGFAS